MGFVTGAGFGAINHLRHENELLDDDVGESEEA
jgi:hypothetical protein